MTPLQGLGVCAGITGIIVASAGAGLLGYRELGASTFEQLTETIFEPEIQDPETQDPEVQEPEVQEPELSDGDPDDPETQDPEVQDPEVQDPEVDDPDPGGFSCPPGFTPELFRLNAPGGQIAAMVCVQQ